MGKPKEGEIYKTLKCEDKEFVIYYGYNCEKERDRWDPAPVFPNFIKTPVASARGEPFARADQDICRYFEPRPKISGEEWCNDCKHFKLLDEIIGVCRNELKNKVRQNE